MFDPLKQRLKYFEVDEALGKTNNRDKHMNGNRVTSLTRRLITIRSRKTLTSEVKKNEDSLATKKYTLKFITEKWFI